MKKNKLCFTIIFCYLSYPLSTANSISEIYHKADSLCRINPGKAAYYCQEAIKLAKEANDSNSLTIIYSKYSYCSMLLGDFDMALSTCYDAMDYCPKENAYMQAYIENHMGSLYSNLKDYRKANELLESAMDKYKYMNDSLGIAQNHNLRGLMYVYLEDNDNAEYYFRKALEINRKINNENGIRTNINNMCLYDGGNWDEKIRLLREAIEINTHDNALWSVAENYNNLGMQYFYASQYNQALNALQKAEDLAKKLNAKELISDNQYYSSLVYASMKDYNKAYIKLTAHNKSLAELNSEKKVREIERDILGRRIQRIKNEAIIKEQQHAISRWKNRATVMSLSGILCFLVTAFIYIWKARKKRLIFAETKLQLEQYERELTVIKLNQKSKELIDTQDQLLINKQELSEVALVMSNHIDVLEKIKDMIKDGYKLGTDQSVPHLKKIVSFITQYSTTNICSRKIQEKVEIQNHEFISRLTHKYPQITPNEKQLASLLRMNISTKEICIITGSAPKAVSMGRYRLRKRLNISPEEDLSEYLQQI